MQERGLNVFQQKILYKYQKKISPYESEP